MAKRTADHPVNEKLPPAKLITYGLQHVLAMYAGAVTVPLVIGGALHLTQEQIIFLISADLFTCGIATLIQTLGFWKFGIRIPVVQGVTFACVQPIIAIGIGIQQAGGTNEQALVVIFTSVAAAGLFTLLIAPLFSKFIHLFPPIVTGTVILAIGLSLIPVAIKMIGGQGFRYSDGSPGEYGTPTFLLIGALVMLTILIANRFLRGFFKNISVLLGLAVGFIASLILGFINTAKVGEVPFVGVDLPLGLNMPGLSDGAYFEAFSSSAFVGHIIPAIISMIIVMIIVMVECTGDYIAIGEIIDLDINDKEIARGLRADGLSTMIGGFLNALPYTAFAQNVGLVALTGIRSRFVVACAGVILVILGLFPKMAALIESLPPFVIGGAAFVMFATVAANGIKSLSRAELDKKPNNIFIIAISIGIGLIPSIGSLVTGVADSPGMYHNYEFFAAVPSLFEPLVGSGISLAAISAILLNIFFNGVSRKTAPGRMESH